MGWADGHRALCRLQPCWNLMWFKIIFLANILMHRRATSFVLKRKSCFFIWHALNLYAMNTLWINKLIFETCIVHIYINKWHSCLLMVHCFISCNITVTRTVWKTVFIDTANLWGPVWIFFLVVWLCVLCALNICMTAFCICSKVYSIIFKLVGVQACKTWLHSAACGQKSNNTALKLFVNTNWSDTSKRFLPQQWW